MTNNQNDENEVPDCIFNSNILTEKEPIGILQLINTGNLSRFSSWKVLQLIHAGEIKCGFPQYGIITVFSLSKDLNQFKEMFDQGCDMLRDEHIITPEIEEQAFRDMQNIIKKQKNNLITVSNPLKKKKKKKISKN